MTPEEAVLQLKRNGTFDELRKQLLSDFQSQPMGHQLPDKITAIMEEMTTKDPSLLSKGRMAFHESVTTELTRAGVANSIRKEVLDSLLQQDHYQQRVSEEIKIAMEKSKDTQ